MKPNMSELINSIASAILLMLAVVFSHRMLYHFLEGFPGVKTVFLWLKNNIKEAEKFNWKIIYIKILDSCLQKFYMYKNMHIW